MIKFEFPKDFMFGTGSSCYQFEGSPYADGKTENIWDWAVRMHPEKYKYTKTEPTSGFYKNFREDVAEMKRQGLKTFRFSISWTRLLPEKDGEVNQKGVDFYNELIDLLLENGIEPFVDIFHWDLPLYLMEIGGFSNKEIIHYFTKFAKVCFESFGDRVKFWSTMNEPSVFCHAAWMNGYWPPYEKSFKKALESAHYALICHYRAVKMYREMNLPGKIGAVIAIVPVYPLDPTSNDTMGATYSMETTTLWWLDPIFLGKYPENILRDCPLYAEAMPEGYAEELASEFVPCDIIGLNYYYPGVAKYEEDSPSKSTEIENYYIVEGQMFENYPAGLYDAMIFVKKRYNNPEIYISENGLGLLDNGSKEDMINDDIRIKYIREHLRMVSRSIDAGVNIKGYYYWSNFDGFENTAGYTYRFGLNYIDFETGERTRKKSWYYYQKVINDCCVD